MKSVIALQMGFLDGRRVRPGTTFQVADDFKASWVADVKSPAAEAAVVAAAEAKGKGKGKKEPATLSELGKEPVQGPTDLA